MMCHVLERKYNINAAPEQWTVESKYAKNVG